MQIHEATSAKDFVDYANECLDSGHSGVVIHVCDEMCVWTGQLGTLNWSECERLGLPVGQGQYLGGSIVNMLGDLSICITTWGNSELAPQIVDRMAEMLQSAGEVSRDENDVLLDGKKVLSWARATMITGWQQSVIHCSVGPVDLETIQAVCMKPMEKIPGSLKEYGITAANLWAVAEPYLI